MYLKQYILLCFSLNVSMLNNTCEADVDNNKAKEHLSMAEEIRNDILNLEVNISFLSCMIYCPFLFKKKLFIHCFN